MALVNYSDSDSDQDKKCPPKALTVRSATANSRRPLKRKLDQADVHDPLNAHARNKKPLPPIPTTLHDLYASNVRTSVQDDPSLHGGRVRQTPHTEGNWPSHVYLEWYPSPTELGKLSLFVSDVQKEASQDSMSTQIHSLLKTDLGVSAPLHVSLSRSLTLLTEQRNPFTEALREEINIAGLKPFDAVVSGSRWVPNFERNRWFLVLQLGRPLNDDLNRLLAATNSAAVEYGQPPLYETVAVAQRRKTPSVRYGPRSKNDITFEDYSDRFHVSIAWALKNHITTKEELDLTTTGALNGITIRFDCVKLKVGNTTESILLVKPVSTAGIAGL